jgi:hypothetical protein
MAEPDTGDLSAPDLTDADASELPLHERLEEAAHSAHTVASHLRLLVGACTTQRGPSLQFRTHSFAAGMQHLSECIRELEAQLDDVPLLIDRHANREIEKCACIAMRTAGLTQLIADATSSHAFDHIELDIDDFMISLQHLAELMKGIQRCVEDVMRAQYGRACLLRPAALAPASTQGSPAA